MDGWTTEWRQTSAHASHRTSWAKKDASMRDEVLVWTRVDALPSKEADICTNQIGNKMAGCPSHAVKVQFAVGWKAMV